jgi:hypothetical protein
MRCGTSGTSGHVTTKSSIRDLGVLYKSGVYAQKVLCLTPGGLYSVLTGGMAKIVAPSGNQTANGEDKVQPEATVIN